MNNLLLEVYDNDVDMRIDEYDYGVVQVRFKKRRHSRIVYIETKDLLNNSVDSEERLLQELRVFLMCISKLEEERMVN